MGTAGGVRLDRDDGVAVLTIDRPERATPSPAPTMQELAAALDEVTDSPACAVLVVTGAGDRVLWPAAT